MINSSSDRLHLLEKSTLIFGCVFQYGNAIPSRSLVGHSIRYDKFPVAKPLARTNNLGIRSTSCLIRIRIFQMPTLLAGVLVSNFIVATAVLESLGNILST